MSNLTGRFFGAAFAVLVCAVDASAQRGDARLSWTVAGEAGILSYRTCQPASAPSPGPSPLCYGNFDRQRLGVNATSSRFGVEVTAERTNVGSVVTLPVAASGSDATGARAQPWAVFPSVKHTTRLRSILTSRVGERFEAAFAVAGGATLGLDSFIAGTRLGFSDRRDFRGWSSRVFGGGEQVLARGSAYRRVVMTSIVGFLDDRVRILNTLAVAGQESALSPFGTEPSIANDANSANSAASLWRESSLSVDLPDQLLRGTGVRAAAVTIAAHNPGFTRQPAIFALGLQLGFH